MLENPRGTTGKNGRENTWTFIGCGGVTQLKMT